MVLATSSVLCQKHKTPTIMYTLKHVSVGRGNRTFLNNLGQMAFVRSVCEVYHASGHIQSGLGVPAFKYWRLYSPVLPFSSTLSPISNLNLSWTPSPFLNPQCHLVLCIGAFCLHGLHSPQRLPRRADLF